MRIALLTFNFWPNRAGMEFVVHDLATQLNADGHGVVVFAPRLRQRFVEIDHEYELVRFGVPFPGAYHMGLNRVALHRAFGRRHAVEPFSVINAHSAYLAAGYALGIRERFGVPVVITCHGHDIQRDAAIGYGLRLDRGKDRRIRDHLARADSTIAISPSIDEELRGLVPVERLARVPNGVADDAFSSAGRGSILDDLGIGRGPVVLSVGRNRPVKQFDVGVRAFAEVARRNPDVVHVHVGDGEGPLVRLAKELGIADRFHALGRLERSEVLAMYREADIFLLPSAVESFGIVTIEAMASGLPCVVTDAPGSRDLVESGRTGLVVPVGDTTAMVQAIESLIVDEAGRSEMGEAARAAVRDRYGWKSVAGQYLDVYRDVAPGGGGKWRRSYDF